MPSEIFQAIREHDVERVASLLARGADPNALQDNLRWRPLEAILEEGVDNDAPPDVVLGIVKLLADRGAEVNYWYEDRELTPLLAAMAYPDWRVARILLEKGADPNVFSEFGFSPLMMAVREGNVPLVKALLSHGATKTINDYQPSLSFGALYIALSDLNVEIVKLLLEAGADPDIMTPDRDTPMSGIPKRSEANAVKWDQVAALLAARRRNS